MIQQDLRLQLCHTVLGEILICELYRNHPGISIGQAIQMSESASVALDSVCRQTEESDLTANFTIETKRSASTASMQEPVRWTKPTSQDMASRYNQIRCTEDAACGICLAAVEMKLRVVAYFQLHTPSRADYLVTKPEEAQTKVMQKAPNIEDDQCLEISGIRKSHSESVADRVKRKEQQVGQHKRPIVAVCGFEEQKLAISVMR
jgi:hypothetical protein